VNGDGGQLSTHSQFFTRNPQSSSSVSVGHRNIQFSTFRTYLRQLLDKIKKETSVLAECKEFCLNLKISDSSNEPLFSDDEKRRINQCKNFKKLFDIINMHCSWSDYGILRGIIEISESEEAQAELVQYEKAMALYSCYELIFDQCISDPPPGFVNLCVILKKSYKRLTVQQYIDAKDFIFDKLDVKQHIARPFIHVFFASVHFEWHVKREAIPHILKMANKRKNIFIQNSYSFIQIDGMVVIDERQVYV